MSTKKKGRFSAKTATHKKRYCRKLPRRLMHVNRQFGEMVRVTRRNPCPVCAKIDQCFVSPDKAAVICPRISEGSVRLIGGIGWLHISKRQSSIGQGSPK